MRNRFCGIFIIAVLTLCVFIWSACSSNAQPPSDADIIEAIDDSGAMKRADGSITVVPPVTIAERGKQNKDGSWPVKATFTITIRMPDGKDSPPAKTTTLFRIFRGKDDKGKSVWKAQLGS